MAKQQQSHFVIVTYPMHDHINPTIQFVERLIHLGVHVTFFTTIGAHRRRMIKSPSPDGLSFSTLSNGYNDKVVPMDNADKRWDQIKCNGSKALTNLIVSTANKQCKSTQCFYLGLLTWPVSFIFLLPFFGFSLQWFWTYTTTITMVLSLLLGTTAMTGFPIQYSYRVYHYYLLLVTFPPSCLLQTHMLLYTLNSKPNLKRLKRRAILEF